MLKNSRSKLFLENFLIYGIGSGFSKIVPFIMLPILTRIYPDSSYVGISENVNTLVSLAYNVALLGVYDSMYRYFFDRDDLAYKKSVTSTALITIALSAVVICVVMVAARHQLSQLLFSNDGYGYLVIIGTVSTFLMAINMIVSAPTRMQNQRVRFLAVNIVTSVVIYGIAIPLALRGYYALAVPLAMMLSYLITVAIFYIMNRKFFSLAVFDRTLSGKMLRLGIPMMPSSIFYWILSSAQKIFVTQLISLEAAGVYSVSAKMAAMSQLIYSAFAAGWQYFNFSTMKDSDHLQVISRIHDYLAAVSALCVCVMVLIARPIFALLFESEYSEGAWAMPTLFLAPLIQMLFQCAGSQFIVNKQSGQGVVCLSAGTAVAIGLDFVLIPLLGIRGAAIANLMGFVIAWVIVVIWLVRKKYLVVYWRMVVCMCIAMTVLFIFTLQASGAVYLIAATAGSLLIIICYLKDFLKVCRSLLKIIRPHAGDAR